MNVKSNQSTFHPRDWTYSAHVDKPGYGVLMKDVMDDAYWSNVSSKMKVGDRIEILPEGLTYYAELIVIDCGPNFAKVKKLRFVDLTEESAAPKQEELATTAPIGSNYLAERAGAAFRVLRVVDKEVMKDGFKTMKSAVSWGHANLKVEA